MTDRYHAFFHIETVPEDFIETAIEQCLGCGFDLIETGGSEYVQQYETADHEFERDADDPDDDYEGTDLSSVATEIREVGEGEVTLWYDGIEFDLSFHVRPDQEWHIPKLGAAFWRWHITPDDKLSRETAQERINHFIEAIAALATQFETEFAYCDTLGVLEDVLPKQRPIADQIERIPWLTVLSEQLVEEFGGYERVLATPAWRVEELDSGHVLLVKSDNSAVPAETSEILLDEYLLEGKSLEELRDESRKL